MRFYYTETRKLLACLGLVALASEAFAQQHPAKLASQARFELDASVAVGSLDSGVLKKGTGSVDRKVWESPAVQPRTYVAHMDVDRFGWSEFEFCFTPLNSGVVTFKLMGPGEWVPGGNGFYKQELFFDQVVAEGTPLTNGSFESGLSGWSGGSIVLGTAATPAFDGLRFARAWHDNGIQTNLNVTGGQEVTLRFYSCAVVPTGFVEMARMGGNTTAHAAAMKFMRGANVGNFLELPGEPTNVSYSDDDFRIMREEGFDHVRLPVAWHQFTGSAPDYALAPQLLLEVDRMVDLALTRGLAIIIDVHQFGEFYQNPAGETARLLKIWEQIAERYKDQPQSVAFELMNEPQAAATTELMNPIYAELITLIRETNPERTIFVGPSDYNGILELDNLVLPDDDDNLIVAVHFYEPFLYTHQGAEFFGSELADTLATTGIVFPGPPPTPTQPNPRVTPDWAKKWIADYNSLPREFNPSSISTIRGRLDRAKRWSEYFGRPVHVGEFGCFGAADPVSRVNYYRAVREVLDENGLGWAMWDWKSGFHYIKNGQPDPPAMRSAMFPKLELETPAPGWLEFPTAKGKSYAIERLVPRNGSPSVWERVDLRTATSSHFEFQDSEAPLFDSAFYRVEWIK